ncbi:hypothetical protein MLD38_029422 [Melastoma candidum]|uniref:Uncharacterized protein n=1 Tax=Melastoma candidum TaxID=119954 RepID=A0ACB9N7Z9_9MYRT|nr:hypothetical protein MLD38_029422 [Melastoma candidum]
MAAFLNPSPSIRLPSPSIRPGCCSSGRVHASRFTPLPPLLGRPSDPNPSCPADDATTAEAAIEARGESGSRSAGRFTEEKARELRLKTADCYTFHGAMYHSAIASRLASDVSGSHRRE